MHVGAPASRQRGADRGVAIGRLQGPRPFLRTAGPILAVAMLIALSVLLRAPLLRAGAASDDFMQYAMLDGRYPTPRQAWDLFNFADGTDADNRPLMDYGTLPWWSAPDIRLAMLRPLASVLVWVDLGLFPDSLFMRHAHSFAWWVVMVSLVAWLFLRHLPVRVALLATALFVFEEGHTMPLGWLAHRGAIVALVFSLLGLQLHISARRGGRPSIRFASLLAFALAFASGEWAFPVLGYLIAYELLAAPGSLGERVRWLLPTGVLAGAFLVARGLLGYGARSSGIYIDPLAEPGVFVVEALQRIPVFFADLMYSVPSDRFNFGTPWRAQLLATGWIPPEIWTALPGHRFWHVLLGLTALALFAALARWVRRRATAATWRELRWLLLGSLLAMLPVLASYATSRLLVPMSIGAFALLSEAITLAVRGLSSRTHAQGIRAGGRGALQRVGAVLMLIGAVHFGFVETIRSNLEEMGFLGGVYESIRYLWRTAEFDDRRLPEQQVFLLNTMEHTSAVFGPFLLHYFGRPMPGSLHVLSGCHRPYELHRVGDRELDLLIVGGTLLDIGMERLYRTPRMPMPRGHRVELAGFSAEVLRADEGLPRQVRFRFPHSLDDPRYVFVEAAPNGLRRLHPPELGKRRVFERSAFPNKLQIQLHEWTRDVTISCYGQRPQLDQCRVGQAFADCGGEGDAIFACHPDGDCRWFEHGCPALGYLPSSCAGASVCCHQNGSWPFDLVDTRMGPFLDAAFRTLQAWGQAPWDSRRATQVALDVDPELPESATSLHCLGLSGGPCEGFSLEALGVYPASLSLTYRAPVAGWVADAWGLTLEAVRTREGTLRARICRVASPPPYAATCEPAPGPDCATAGRLAITGFSDDAVTPHGRFWARFADGAVVDGAF